MKLNGMIIFLLAFAAGVWAQKPNQQPVDAGNLVITGTYYIKNAYNVSWLPDGKNVVFSRRRSGCYVSALTGAKEKSMGTKLYFCGIAPNGQAIYQSDRNGFLYRTSVATGKSIKLGTKQMSYYNSSPNGKYLLVNTSGKMEKTYGIRHFATDYKNWAVINTEGKVLNNILQNKYAHSWLWSPDGKFLNCFFYNFKFIYDVEKNKKKELPEWEWIMPVRGDNNLYTGCLKEDKSKQIVFRVSGMTIIPVVDKTVAVNKEWISVSPGANWLTVTNYDNKTSRNFAAPGYDKETALPQPIIYWMPDGKRYITGNTELKKFQLINTQNPTTTQSLQMPYVPDRAYFRDDNISPDKSLLSYKDETFKSWIIENLQTGSILNVPKVDLDGCNWSPNNNAFVCYERIPIGKKATTHFISKIVTIGRK